MCCWRVAVHGCGSREPGFRRLDPGGSAALPGGRSCWARRSAPHHPGQAPLLDVAQRRPCAKRLPVQRRMVGSGRDDGWRLDESELGRPIHLQRGWDGCVGSAHPQRPRPRATHADPAAQDAFKGGLPQPSPPRGRPIRRRRSPSGPKTSPAGLAAGPATGLGAEGQRRSRGSSATTSGSMSMACPPSPDGAGGACCRPSTPAFALALATFARDEASMRRTVPCFVDRAAAHRPRLRLLTHRPAPCRPPECTANALPHDELNRANSRSYARQEKKRSPLMRCLSASTAWCGNCTLNVFIACAIVISLSAECPESGNRSQQSLSALHTHEER